MIRVNIRHAPVLTAAALVLVVAGCDTGDGKQLQPFDPADYPSQTAPASVETIAEPVDTGVLGTEVADTSTDGAAEAFTLIAPWQDGGTIDARYTCDGADLSPALSWGAVPPGTVEVAIAMVDESAVSDGEPFVHWVISGLDPLEIAIADGDVPPGSLQALNFFGAVGYGGPCPPPADDAHEYRLTAYALGQQLEVFDGDLATDFLDVIELVAIGSADVTGLYQRSVP